MAERGWLKFFDRFLNGDYLDPFQTTAPLGTVAPYQGGNSKRITWEIPNGGFNITKDGSGNKFSDWGGDTFGTGFGNFTIRHNGTDYLLTVAAGAAANGAWLVKNYAIGPYQVQVDTGYMGNNMYRMTVSETTGQRPELVFTAGGQMASNSTYTVRFMRTYELNGQTHHYVVNTESSNTTGNEFLSSDTIFYMTVVPLDKALDNLFTGANLDLQFNAGQLPIKLPFTVYMCAHNGGQPGRDAFLQGIKNDVITQTPLGALPGTSQIVSAPIPVGRMRELTFDGNEVLQGNGSVQYQIELGGQWHDVAKGDNLLFLEEENIRLKATLSVPDSTSDAAVTEWKVTGYINHDAIFHG